MANTTFKGTVRAESGLKVTTQAASTGVYTDDFSVDSAGILTRRQPAILVIGITFHVQLQLFQHLQEQAELMV